MKYSCKKSNHAAVCGILDSRRTFSGLYPPQSNYANSHAVQDWEHYQYGHGTS